MLRMYEPAQMPERQHPGHLEPDLQIPGEIETHRTETLRVMSDISDRFPNVSFSPSIFTLYPGMPVWPALPRRGLKKLDLLRPRFDLCVQPLCTPTAVSNLRFALA